MPAVEAWVVDLPDALRAWARAESLVWFLLSHHIADGVPLTECLAEIVRALGDDGLREVRVRLATADRTDLRAWLSPQAVRRSP